MPTPAELIAQSNKQLAETLGQLARYLREAKNDAQGVIHGFYREARRIVEASDAGAGLQVRPEILTLQTALSTSTVSDQQTQKLPDTEDFVVLQLRGVLGITDWTTEYNYDGPRSRMLVKASNCKINFKLADMTGRVYTAKNDMLLSQILVEAGGKPIDFAREGAPAFVIPHSLTPQVTCTLQDPTAAVVGPSANYGISLIGCYISRPR